MENDTKVARRAPIPFPHIGFDRAVHPTAELAAVDEERVLRDPYGAVSG